MSQRNPYTKEEDTHLIAFMAVHCPGLSGRQGNKLYQMLTQDPKAYPWGKGHSWQAWRDHYKSNKAYFDHKIAKYQKRNGIVVDAEGGRSSQRKLFTDDEDKLLIKFLAVYCRQKTGRSGNAPYKMLVENAEGKWPWSARHPYQGWRSRYVDNAEYFDLRIQEYQRKHNIDVNAPPPKRPANGSQSENAAKRRRIEDTYDSQEERWSKINWPSPNKNAARPSPIKAVESKVETKPKVPVGPIASTSKVQVVNEVERDAEHDRGDNDDDDDDDDNDDIGPIGSEDYRGEIFQNGTLAASQGQVEKMSGIEEDVAGEEEACVPNPSPALNGHRNESPEKELREAEELLQNRDQPETESLVNDVPPSSLSPPKPTQPKHASFSRNEFTLISQSRRLLNDDPFEDDPSSPYRTRNLPLQKSKRPPVITEGAFGNRLQTGTKRVSKESSTEDSSDDKETSAAWHPSPRPPRTKESNGVKVDPTWPPPRAKKSHAEGVNGTIIKIDLERQAAEKRRREKGKQKAVEPDQSMGAPVGEHHPPVPSLIQQPQPSSTRALHTTEAGSSRTLTAQRRASDSFPPAAPLPEIIGVKSPKRHSTGNIRGPRPSNSRIINLRQEIAHRQLLSQQRRRRSSSRASHVSPPIISEDDFPVSRPLEFASQCLELLSEQSGFTVDVVSRAWDKRHNLRQMMEILKSMKENVDRSIEGLSEGISNVSSTFSIKGEDTSKSVKTGLRGNKEANINILDFGSSQSSPFTAVYPDQNDSSAVKERRGSGVGVGGRRGRKSLDIRPVDPELASADADPFYHPLTGTRAGNFDRLVKMGRGGEALEREQRRVSSVALSPLRNMSQEQSFRTQGVPEGDTLGSNDDDVYEEVDIPIQGEDSDEEDMDKMDVLPTVEPKDEEMGEVSLEVEGRMIKVEPDTSQPQLNGLERRYHDVENEQSELNDTCPKSNGRESVEQEKDFEPDIDVTKSRSAEEVEAMVEVRTEAERWEEVEDLFLAANRSSMEMLKEIEKEFSADFLSEWLTSKFTI